MNLDRNVRVPGVKVPEPNWANACGSPPGAEHVVRRLRAAVEPDDGLDRTAPLVPASRASRALCAHSQSTIVPLPASP